MKVVLILALTLGLSGCVYQTVSSNDIATAHLKCATENAEVLAVTAHFSGQETVECSNRKTYAI